MDETARYVISGRVVTVQITDDAWVMHVGRTTYAVVIGVMLLAPAVVLLLWGSGVIAFTGGAGRPPLGWTLILGLPFLWLGLYGALGRRGLTIDRRRASVCRWWGFLGPLVARTCGLPDDVGVVLRPNGKPTDRNAGAVVLLRVGDRRIRVEAPDSRRTADDLAARLAKFLGTKVKTDTSEP